ncbi:MAG: ribonuclease HII, partial [Thaumarchaeota archaeon]|nr:ribonuclease HII [Nitrososphaerota archaeon]
MLVGGVDEAGRGSVLGPLAVAGVSLDSSRLCELEALGVKDSKLLTPNERESLYVEILKICSTVMVSRIPPREIDNYLEAIHMAKVIDTLRAEEVFIDAPDKNPARWTGELESLLSCKPRIVAEHRADVNYVVVSAASIVAKVERDQDVAELREIHGDFGSGYPSDPDTIEFLRSWMQKENARPEFSRKSWKTWS